jgi:glycosyltransferase involved in cell wall biosynthesis
VRSSQRTVKVAYVMSRFPKITETFVLYEMLELQKLGLQIEVFPLLREKEAVEHPEAAALVQRAHYQPFCSWPILRAHLHFLRLAPGNYLATAASVLLHTLKSPNFFLGALGIWPKSVLFARLMRDSGVAHVHAHFANHPALAALIIHRLTAIPFSFTAHGSDLHVDQTALGWKLSEADFAVTVSSYNKQFVRERVGPPAVEKLRVIHCGIDPSVHVRSSEPPGEVLEILCVGALREVKGHRYLIEACQLLRERGIPFRCQLIGSGPLARRIRRQIAAAGLEREIEMPGALPRQELVQRMAGAHVLVLPSIVDRSGRREGIPVTLMEAMSCGLPVVASDLSGIPELIENERSGILTPPGQAAAIAAALERLHASRELRARLGRAAREKVLADFNLSRSAERLASLILERRLR